MNKIPAIFLIAVCFFPPSHAGADHDSSAGVGGSIVSSDVFGKRGGYIHPFLSVAELYSDNIFNTSDHTVSDFVTVVSPGIWLALPRVKEQVINIETSSETPGGLDLDLKESERFRRFQIYGYYSPDFKMFADHSDEDTTDHKVEGFFQYNFRGGLKIGIFDQFFKSHDERGTGISTQLDKYQNNVTGLRLSYDLSDRFKLRGDYVNFCVNYDADRNDARDRIDNSFSAYLYFKFKPKTSFFAQYKYIAIEYGSDFVSDSSENQIYFGFQWNITAKSSGRVKAGYAKKEFDNSLFPDEDAFVMELNVKHDFTPKTSLAVIASRRERETNIIGLKDMVTTRLSTTYVQKFTSKITGSVNLAYLENDYNGLLSYGNETKERKDRFYTVAPLIEYKFKKWLGAEIAYKYTRRNSNFDDFDYKDNTVFLKVVFCF